jgi:hypothetical protein
MDVDVLDKSAKFAPHATHSFSFPFLVGTTFSEHIMAAIISGLEAEILVDIGFYMAAIFKIQDGRHNVFGGSGSYQKWKAKVTGNM